MNGHQASRSLEPTASPSTISQHLGHSSASKRLLQVRRQVTNQHNTTRDGTPLVGLLRGSGLRITYQHRSSKDRPPGVRMTAQATAAASTVNHVHQTPLCTSIRTALLFSKNSRPSDQRSDQVYIVPVPMLRAVLVAMSEHDLVLTTMNRKDGDGGQGTYFQSPSMVH